MKIAGPLLPGRFIDRPNRFLTRVELDGQIVESHLPDPGRLKELLFPGTTVYLRPAPVESKRKTRFSTVMTEHNGVLISLDSTLPNHFVKEGLRNHSLPQLRDFELVRPEVKFGRHRFDFLLRSKRGLFYLEVKSVTFVKDGIARFPDAVTERGARHVATLGEIVVNGTEAGILFVCQRHDAKKFQPMFDRDPHFAHELVLAHERGVNIWCITTKVSLDEMVYWQEIPLSLNA